ncbi:hypothetical protein CDL12_18955 [Handroanthus impetiginosus]|uniref:SPOROCYTELESS-like EAR-containing protein n=1 Tax=Handroanthus impetiginosus TaxID=429701 RepID=A0A2G9GT48_9LAMI|nr:hypothetical protein CDL12_18955 [Handroanthus impetiginosus]
MGSNYWNERGHAGLSSSSSSSSSRKGKKGSSDKPKQPQRGLGVAQLEKIRLHSQLGCNYLSPPVQNPYASNFGQDMRMQTAFSPSSSSFSYSSSSSPSYGFQGHHGVMVGLPDLDRANITYGDSQPSSVARWPPGNAGYGQHFVEPNMTRSFLEPGVEGPLNNNKKDWKDFMGSSSHQDSESNSSQEIDLELRLSL